MAIEIVDISIEHGDLNHSYVELPEGIAINIPVFSHYHPYKPTFNHYKTILIP